MSDTSIGPNYDLIGLRAFVPTAGRLFFDAQSLNLFGLDLDIMTLTANAREAVTECDKRITGRMTFGEGARMVEVVPRGVLDYLDDWWTKRRAGPAPVAEDGDGDADEDED